MFSVYANGQLIYFPLEEDLVINSPKLNLEMGKAGSFQFGLPPTHRYYNLLQNLKTIITVEYDGVEIFRGRVLTMNRGFNNIRQVVCEGDLAYLVDSVQKGVKYKGGTHALFRKIIANHNSRVEDSKKFTVGNITVLDKDVIISGSSDTITKYETTKFDYEQIVLNSIVDDWMTTYDYIQDTIIEYCGGYLRTRRVGNTTYIDLLKDYGQTSVQKIEFGTNLIDLNEEVKSEDLYTVLIPLGEDNLTISKLKEVHEVGEGPSGDLIYYTSGDEIIDVRGVAQYGRIVKTHTFDSVNNVETLVENGFDLLRNHENMPITFTVKAVDMHMVDGSNGAIYVGDKVYLNSIPHSLTQYLTCTKIEYDMNNPANNTYTFGNPKQTMTERYKKDKEKTKKSGRSSAGKAGKAADVASVEADTNLEQFAKDEGRRIDAWLNVDPDQGHIDLGAFYEKWNADRMVLRNDVGINLDAIAGTVDIFSMNKTLDNHGNQISTSEARIQTLANDQEAQVKQFTDFQTKTTSSLTSIIQRSDAQGASIEALAKYDTQNTKNLAGITARVSAAESQLKSFTEFSTDTKKRLTSIEQISNDQGASIKLQSEAMGKLGNRVASIEITANDLESKINLKANTVTVDAKILDAKKALRAEFNEIVANKISAGFTMTGRLNAVDINASGLVSVKDIKNTNKATLRNLAVTGKCTCEYNGVQSAIATQAWVKEQLKNYASSTHKHSVSIAHTHATTIDGKRYTIGGISVTSRDTGTPK